MAKKRRLEVERTAKEEAPPEPVKDEEIPEKFRDMPWREWFTKVYAKYWYILACAFVDIMLWLSLMHDVGLSWDVATFFALLPILPEYYVYWRLWKKNEGEKEQ
jgi:amino acid permease